VRKTLMLTAIIAIVVAVAAGCGGGSDGGPATEEGKVEAIIRNMFAAYNAQDFATCLSYSTDFGDMKEALAELAMSRFLAGEITVQRVEGIEIAGTAATASVTARFGSIDVTETVQVQLRKKSGVWKVVWGAMWENGTPSGTPTPAVTPTPGPMTGTVEMAPELQGVVEVEYSLVAEEDGGLSQTLQYRNVGNEPIHVRVTAEIYGVEGELLWDYSEDPNITPYEQVGIWGGFSGGFTKDDDLSKYVARYGARYKVTVTRVEE